VQRFTEAAACVWRLQVIPVFAGGLDFSSPVKKFFFDPLGSGKAFVATVVSLTGGLRRCWCFVCCHSAL
jgi:hypothetical protein